MTSSTPLERAVTRLSLMLSGAINALLAEKKDDEAVVPLEEALAASLSDGVRAAMQDQLDKLRAGAALNRSVREYNEAVARWNRGDLNGALAPVRTTIPIPSNRQRERPIRSSANGSTSP
jgi:hypothetical protein